MSASGVLPAQPDLPGKLNTSGEQMLANVKANIQRSLPQVKPYYDNPDDAILALSGPSLATNLRALKRLTPTCPLVTVNGSHDWLIEQGCTPSAHVMLDAREANADFVRNPVKSCRYLIASQCHPKVFEALEKYEVHIFHCDLGVGEEKALTDHYCGKNYHIVIGGSTVGLRAMMLLRMLGFKRLHIFGFDSCFLGKKHHAFPQALNDKDVITAEVGGMGRKFYCAPWMLRQAYEFQDLMRANGHLLRCKIHGSGLIATMVKAGAQAQLKEV